MIAAVAKIAGIPVVIGGETKIMPPLSLNAVKQLMPRLEKFKAGVDEESIETLAVVAHASLVRNYPGITVDWVADNVDLGNMQDIMDACMDVSGLKRKQLESSGEI